MLCKDLSSNPCHELSLGWLFQPLSDNLNVEVL